MKAQHVLFFAVCEYIQILICVLSLPLLYWTRDMCYRIVSGLKCIYLVCSSILGFCSGTINECAVIFVMAGISVYSAYSVAEYSSILHTMPQVRIRVRLELWTKNICRERWKGICTMKMACYLYVRFHGMLRTLAKLQNIMEKAWSCRER